MATITNATTLPLYWDLASIDPQIRENAALSLISSLVNFQEAHKQAIKDKWENLLAQGDGEERLDALSAPDVSYAIKRLIRGLPSSRQGARQGFSLALTELLATMDFITVKLVTDLLFKFTERTGAMKGEEERDMLFGRIFGFMCIVDSGILRRPTTIEGDFERIVDSLIEMASTKSYLSECCYHVIISMLPHIAQLKIKDKALTYIVKTGVKDGIHSPDQLNLVLAIQQQFPNFDLSTILLQWKNGEIFHPANLNKLAQVLKESTSDSTPSQSNWRPQPHSVWDRILSLYLDPVPPQTPNGSATPKLKRGKPKSAKDHPSASQAIFQDFWRVVVDETLFDNAASHERRCWGFQIVEKTLPRLPADQTPLIFTANFMRCFINNLSSEDRFLSKAARHTMTIIHQVAASNKEVGFALVTQLLGKHGTPHFDRVTKTKTVETLLGTMDAAGVQSYITFLTNTFLRQSDSASPKKVDTQRQWAVDQMHALVRSARIPKEEVWLLAVLEFFLVHAFFEVKKVNRKSAFTEAHELPSPPLSATTREICRTRLYSALGELSTMPPPGTAVKTSTGKVSRQLNGTTGDGEFWAYKLVVMASKLEEDENFECLVKLREEAVKARRDAWQTAEKIRGHLRDLKQIPGKHEHESQYRAFELLFLHVMLQLFTEEKEATPVLGELQDCYTKVFAKKMKRTPKKKTSAEEEGEEPQPVDVLIDILVSFLAKPSALLRSLSEQVFQIFSDKMTKTSLDLLLSILETKESKAGQEELFEVEGEDEDDDDVEEMDVEGEGGENNGEDNNEEDEDDVDDESDGDADEEVDEEFRAKLAEALNVQGMLAEGDGNDDEEEEELLGDEDMAEFDEKLAEIFRLKKLQKAEKKDAKQNIIYFKNKILDLLEIFIRKHPENPLIFDIILPLLALLRSTSSTSATKQMVDKTTALLNNKLAKIKDYPRDFDAEHLHSILEQVHESAKRAPNNQMVTLCGRLSLVLVKTLVGGHDENDGGDDKSDRPSGGPAKAQIQANVDRIISLYASSLADFMTKKSSRLQPVLFLDFIDRFPRTAWGLCDPLLEYSRPAGSVKAYRQVQAYEMLGALVRRGVARAGVSGKMLSKAAPRIADVVAETLKFAVGEGQINTQRIKLVLKFMASAVRVTKKVEEDTSQLKIMWKADMLTSLIESVAKDPKYHSPAVRTLCQQLLDLLGTGIKLPQSIKEDKPSAKADAKVSGKGTKEDLSDKKRKRADKEDGKGGNKANKKSKVESKPQTEAKWKAKAKAKAPKVEA